MVDYSDAINQQYGRNDINVGILNAFQMAGFDVDELSLDELSRFDQLHTGGRRATRLCTFGGWSRTLCGF